MRIQTCRLLPWSRGNSIKARLCPPRKSCKSRWTWPCRSNRPSPSVKQVSAKSFGWRRAWRRSYSNTVAFSGQVEVSGVSWHSIMEFSIVHSLHRGGYFNGLGVRLWRILGVGRVFPGQHGLIEFLDVMGGGQADLRVLGAHVGAEELARFLAGVLDALGRRGVIEPIPLPAME